jgi:Ser/Thr protein kinase RdoA (MazF antagonist)
MNEHVEQVLRLYPGVLGSLDIAPIQPEPGFSGADVLRLTGESGEYCLRGWPVNFAHSLPQIRLLGLHQLLRSISEAGVDQVAVPIATVQGATVVERFGRTWQLEPWMPGRACFREDPNDRRLCAAMECLAEWHNAARSFQCPPNCARWFSSTPSGVSPACGERWQSLSLWLAKNLDRVADRIRSDTDREFRQVSLEIVDLVRRTGPGVQQEIGAAVHWPVPLQPCLRDVWHDHILLTGDRVTGLIDPSACRSESVATDLARLLGSLVGDQADRWNRALEVYAGYRRLNSAERRLVGVLDRSAVVLSGLTWLRRRYLPDAAEGCSFDWERVLDRLQSIAVRLRTLAKSDKRVHELD